MKLMNYFKMMLAGALVLALASCENISPVENSSENGGKDGRTVKLGLQMEPGTKVTLSNDATPVFAWEKDDQISVYTATAADATGAFQTGVVEDNSGTKRLSVTIPSGQERFHYAVYPSSVNHAYNVSTGALTISLPSSYTLDEVSDDNTPVPMIADNTGDALVFYNVGGALRLTVNYIPATTSYLKIDFDGKKVQGAFSIASPNPGESEIATSTTDGTDDIITITDLGISSLTNGMVLNLPLPTGDYNNFSVTAYNSSDKAIVTATRPFAYAAARKKGTRRTVSFPSSKTAFRGYEVSTGILERSKVGSDPATYSLTSGEMVMTYDPVTGEEIYALPAGCNPFEPAVNYGQSSALNKYYNKWLTLRDELGADGNNINAASEKLPAGWRFPSGGGSAAYDPSTVWGTILYGAPKSPITVNGETLKKINSTYYTPFAKVAVTLEEGNGYSVAAGTYYGIFLIRDGLTIPTGYFSKIGFSNAYTENVITETKFNDLIRMGCLFIPAAGYYNELYSSWRSSSQEGYYWSNTYNSENIFIFCYFDSTTGSSSMSVAKTNTSSHKYYSLVKLVKPINP